MLTRLPLAFLKKETILTVVILSSVLGFGVWWWLGASENAKKNETKQTNPSPVATADPTVSLLADPATVSSGGSSTLKWSSKNATSCTAGGGWSGPQDIFGSESTTTLTSTQTYSLTCTGSGSTATQSVTIKVSAALSLPPSPAPPPAPSSSSGGVVAGSTITVTNATWRCNKALSSYGKLPIKVTQTWSNAASAADSIKDSIWLEKGCTGDSDPNTIDLILDVQGNGGSSGTADDAITLKHGAYDIQISGHFECGARQGGAHQDGVQMNGAERIKFIGVTSGNVSDANPAKWTPTCHGAGGLFYVSELNDNDALLVDVVCEGCKMAAVNAGLSIYGSTRSGAINSIFTGRRPCFVSTSASNSPTSPVNTNNTCTDTG